MNCFVSGWVMMFLAYWLFNRRLGVIIYGYVMCFVVKQIPELKKECKSRGLSTAGNKAELVARLQSAMAAGDLMNSLII
jgi:hypothetical protein